MALSNEGNFVDLTLDSDDDVRSASYQIPASASTSPPRKTPIPLPANVRQSNVSAPASTLNKTTIPPRASSAHKKTHAALLKPPITGSISNSPLTNTPLPRKTPVPLPENVRSKTFTPTPRPTKSHVPLPGSACYPPQPRSINGSTDPKRIPTGTTPPTSLSRPSTTASPASMRHNAASKGYVPISSSIQKELCFVNSLNDTEQVAKRRKLSVHGVETGKDAAQSFVSGKTTSGQSKNNGLAHGTMSGKTQVASNLGSILSANAKATSTYKPPSVQHMNAALKTNRTAITVVNNVLGDNPRPLNIGTESPADIINGLLRPNTSTSETAPMSSSDADSVVKTTGITKKIAIHNQAESKFISRTETTQNTVASPLTRHVATNPLIHWVQDDDTDTHMSDTSDPIHPLTVFPDAVQTMNRPTPVSNVKVPGQTLERNKQFSQEEDHFLIFLKEVKRYSWARITTEFNLDYPGRKYAALQTNYSSRLNKRDRSRDPTVLKLPTRFASEASIDWQTVYAESSGPRVRSELMALHQDASALCQQTRRLGRPSGKPPLAYTTTECSSGTESPSRRERTRRATAVNHTWPRQRESGLGDEMDTADGDQSTTWNSTRSETPKEFLQRSERAVAVDNDPIDMNFDANDAAVALATWKASRNVSRHNLPYLTSTQRSTIHDTPSSYGWNQLSSRDWQGLIVHVDFSPAEIDVVNRAIAKVSSSIGRQSSRHSTQRRHLRTLLKGITEPKLLRIANEVRRYLPSRDRTSIAAFLQDAMTGKISDSPKIQRLAAAKIDKSMKSDQKISTLTMIRQRELGVQSRRGWKAANTPLTYQTRNKYMDTLGPSHTWTGAAGDIHTVAWSPNGQCFVAGAVAVTDPDSMQYNRPNNLMYGDVSRGTIHELGEHKIERPRTKTGANSTHAMFVSQDPRLYTTVSSVRFSRSGRLMYSAGYDKNVCVWEITADTSQPVLVSAWKHKAEVDLIALNPRYDGKLATAAKRPSGNAIKLISIENEDDPSQFTKTNYYSAKAVSRSDLRILPTALQFEPRYGRLLLAGFGANVREDYGLDTTGDICLWDIETQTQMNVHGSSKNIFDVTFNPNQRHMPFFAYGCVATGNVNKGTRSLIRLYERATPSKYTCPLEIECKALDMNDVVWCPHDEHLIAAGCTDGKAYVWDMRMPNDPLRVLSHGQSKMPLQDDVHPECTDTGIRFLSWGENATRLYSGSSDGVVKVWDVTRAHENTFIKDLITTDSGIMSGSFSPDMSKLVVGEVNGSISVLEVGRDDCSIREADKLQYISYASYDTDDEVSMAGEPALTESSIADANYLLQTGQMRLAPMGGLPIRQAVQGPNYEGPFDQSVDAPFLRQQALEFQLSLPARPGPPCSIPGCEESISKTTSEEIGDSKRSTDRIPDELRRQWKTLDFNLVIPGKSKCTHCTRPARHSSSSSDAPILCERCSFACFRCGAANSVASVTTRFLCDSCAGVWEIGVLGYDCVEQPTSTGEPLDVPRMKKFGKESYLQRLEDVDTTFGDEMNALTEFYYSLAIDGPESHQYEG